MRELARDVFAAVIGGLILAVILELAGRGLYSVDPALGLLANPWARFLGLAVFSVLLLYSVIWLIKKRRERLRKANRSSIFTITQPPREVFYEGEIEKFGIRWKGQYGNLSQFGSLARDDPYAYVVGPICPHDGRDLVTRTVSHWFVFTKDVWVCTHCDGEFPRPTRHFGKEHDVVEKEFEAIFQEQYDKDGGRPWY